jgi:hypothetical protein
MTATLIEKCHRAIVGDPQINALVGVLVDYQNNAKITGVVKNGKLQKIEYNLSPFVGEIKKINKLIESRKAQIIKFYGLTSYFSTQQK